MTSRHLACNAIGVALLIAGAFVAETALAQIQSIEGVPSDGATIVIKGAGFGEKPNPAPLYFFDFSKGSKASTGRVTFSGEVRGEISSAETAPRSAAALRADVGGNRDAVGPKSLQFSGDRLFVWVKRRYGFDIVDDAGPNGLNLKSLRFWSPGGNNLYVNWQGSEGRSSGRAYAEQTTPGGAVWFGLAQLGNRWVIDEFDYVSSRLGQTDGVLRFARNGQKAWDDDMRRFQTITSSYPQRYDQLYFDQISNNQLKPGTFIFMDSVYVDDSRARVYVSDEETWQRAVFPAGTERSREIQIPIAWSPSAITVRLRQGSFSTLKGRFLYVIAPNGEPVSTRGFRIGAGLAAPAAPQAVTVR